MLNLLLRGFLVCAALTIGKTADAVVYNVDMSLTDSYVRYDQDPSLPAPVLVTGAIETDGTMGAITSSNIMSWAFSITDGRFTQSISSASVNPYGRLVTAVSGLWASASSLTSSGSWAFQDESIQRGYYGGFQRWVDTQSTDRIWGTYQSTGGRMGFLGEDRVAGTVVLGQVASVPLPATIWLLGAGLLALIYGGRRRRRAI